MPIRLIASDLDGTLLRSDQSVSPRTRAGLDAARARGLLVVPVTARQPRGVRRIAEAAGFEGWAICGNGAQAVHLGTGEVLFEEHIPVPVQQRLGAALFELLPELHLASVRQGGERFVAQAGYAALSHFEDHKRPPAEMGAFSLPEVLAEPSLKLVLRHPHLKPFEVLRQLQTLPLSGFEVTHSGAPFLEVMAQGVTKASGLARLCQHLGVVAAEVLAFGDAPNDAELLAWAGRGVAVSNAHPEARAAAAEQCPSNDEDGVAITIETLLGNRLLNVGSVQ